MDGAKDSLQLFEPCSLNINKITPITKNVTFPDSESLVETSASIIVAENDSVFIESSDCSGVTNSIKESEIFSEILFNNNSAAHIRKNELSKVDSGILELESIADDSSKLIGLHGIKECLSENSGDMTCDFNLEENFGQFEDDEFRSAIDFFNDPSFLNFLENSSFSTVSSNPSVFRDSLYRNFDPLYANYFSEYNNIPNEQLKAVKEDIDSKAEKSNTLTFNNVQNEVQSNASLLQSIGNMLISFDSPIIEQRKNSFCENISVGDSQKLYTEEDLKKALENQELAIRGTFLRKQKDLEELFLRRMEELETEFQKQKSLSNSLCIILKEATHLVNVLSDKKKILELNLAKAEKVNNNLKEDLDTFVSDLQKIEHTFSNFHKEFEQSTTMLKLYIQNESLVKQLENMNTQLNDKEKIYKELQNRSLEIMDKSNIEITSPNRSGRF